MIDLRLTWMPGLLELAEIIADTEVLQTAWTTGDRSRTAITDVDELFVQIFDDLDTEGMLEQAKGELSDDPVLPLIECFIARLLDLERTLPREPTEVLSSQEWDHCREAARSWLDVSRRQA